MFWTQPPHLSRGNGVEEHRAQHWSCGTNCVRFVVNMWLRSGLISCVFLSEADFKRMCGVGPASGLPHSLRAALHFGPTECSPTFGPEQGDHASQ